MSRFARLLLPATTLVAAMAVAVIVTPHGEAGEPRAASRSATIDHYTFGRDVSIDTPANGNVQVYGGSAAVNATVDGDLLVVGGDARFGAAGRVTGNVIAVGGRAIDARGRVGGRLYATRSAPGAMSILGDTTAESRGLFALVSVAIKVTLLALWLAVSVALVVFNGREVRYASIEVRSSALHCFTLGLVALTSFVLTAVVFGYLIPFVIGYPLLAVLGVVAVATKVYGMVAVFHAVGTLIAGARSAEQLASRRWMRGDLAMVVIGLLILGAIRLVPVVGSIVWAVSSLFGVGVALATKFGRREPWFLALQPT
jgi:hypothetical protein